MARPTVRKPTARKPAAKRPAKAAKGASRVSSLSQDTRNWIANNFDARNALVLVMIVVGVVTVAPNVQTFFSYRQQIADMQAQVDAEKTRIQALAGSCNTAGSKGWRANTVRSMGAKCDKGRLG